MKYGDVTKLNHIFGSYMYIVHKNKVHHWPTEMKLNQKRCFIFKILNFENGPFYFFFALFYLTFRSNVKITATFGLYI